MKNQALINEMTLMEKCSLLSGKSVWETYDIPRLAIPSLSLSDGPHGIRKQMGSADHLGLNASIPATCFPTAATIANSWDTNLAREVGSAIGEEAKQLGVQVVLGPGMNIKRNPLGGRNFEYFSEDPYLTGELAASYVNGIQNNDVSACAKHYAVNSQELRRMSNDSVVDERALREIYLSAFKKTIEKGNPDFLMTSYNKVNGEYANEHQTLLQDILYGEWHYENAVVTDWGGSNDHVLGVKMGSHLEMPGTGIFGPLELKEAVESGELTEEVLNQRVDELLSIILKVGKNQSDQTALKAETIKAHEALAYKAAVESAVLLKNDDDVLPLDMKKNIAIVGEFASEPRYQGAGSSLVNPTSITSVMAALNSDHHYFKGYTRDGQSNQALVDEAIEGVKGADAVVVFAGLPEIYESEGIDRTDIKLPDNQVSLIESLAKANKNIVVVLFGGAVIEMPWIHQVKSVLHTYLPGQSHGKAIIDLLAGNVSPSGKLSETYPLTLEDVPSFEYFPGEQRTSEYRESLFVGYRYYETADVQVQFPFGYGLSYTTFRYHNLKVSENKVTFDLTNTGKIKGAEIAQVYAEKVESAIFRSSKELIGFKKVILEPRETKQVAISLSDDGFQFYNSKTHQWEIEEGEYTIIVGENCQDIQLRERIFKKGLNASDVYSQEIMAQYKKADVKQVSDAVFEELLGRKIPQATWDEDELLTRNDTLSQMYYAKGWTARRAYSILTFFLNRSIAKQKPNLNLYFNYYMPFRAMGKMTGGAITQPMVTEIVRMVNGHFWSGMTKLTRIFLRNRKIEKEVRSND
ncbi:beta-glucosidase family protein [Marinilactibacillus kalidii]|uniref:beta-glucosidase family protein n=1 Tax=Marinilactibacillus kalidii TaxID=2820274 RepID=UPI001ABED50F|nr:glycoside hydrolase family 3 C-terminal domain-containing protein [Marinilactibacillus kalidii]